MIIYPSKSVNVKHLVVYLMFIRLDNLLDSDA